MDKICIAPKYLKLQLINKYHDENVSINFLTKDEFIDKFCFDTDIYSIFKYFVEYKKEDKDASLNLFIQQIKTLKYIDEFKTNNSKINSLKEIYNTLSKKQILIKDDFFISFAKRVAVDIYIYDEEVDKDLFKILKKFNIKYNLISFDKQNEKKFDLSVFTSNKTELGFVLNSIYNDIYLSNCSQEDICLICPQNYNIDLQMVGQMFNLNFSFSDDDYFSLEYMNNFYNNFSFSLRDNFFKEVEGSTDVSTHKANLYIFLKEAEELNLNEELTKEYLYYQFKHHKLSNSQKYFDIYNSFEEINKNYKKVYIVGFNNDIEQVFKDDNYLFDDELVLNSYSLTSTQKKIQFNRDVISYLNSVESLFLSYSLYTTRSQCYENSLLLSYKDKFTKPKNLDDVFYLGGNFFFTDFFRYYASEKMYNYDLYKTKSSLAYKLKKDLDVSYDKYSNNFKKKQDIFIKNINNNISTSKMDEYESCPFKYYLNRFVFKDEFSDSLSNMRGNYIHKLLEILYSQIKIENYTDLQSDEFKQYQEKVIEELFNKVDIKSYYLSNENDNRFLDTINEKIKPMLRYNIKLRQQLINNNFNFYTETEYFKTIYLKNLELLVSLEGKIDLLLHRTKNKNLNNENNDLKNLDEEYYIFDFKTGVLKPYIDNNLQTNKVTSNNQLNSYFYLLNKHFDYTFEEIINNISFHSFSLLEKSLNEIFLTKEIKVINNNFINDFFSTIINLYNNEISYQLTINKLFSPEFVKINEDIKQKALNILNIKDYFEYEDKTILINELNSFIKYRCRKVIYSLLVFLNLLNGINFKLVFKNTDKNDLNNIYLNELGSAINKEFSLTNIEIELQTLSIYETLLESYNQIIKPDIVFCGLNKIYKLNKLSFDKKGKLSDLLDDFTIDNNVSFTTKSSNYLLSLNDDLSFNSDVKLKNDSNLSKLNLFSKKTYETTYDDVIESFENNLTIVVKNLKDNKFDVRPLNKNVCSYCKFADICYKKPSDFVEIDNEEAENGENSN